MPGPFCFAWTGGSIQESTTLVTNGNTHGAVANIAALVGDVTAGGQQLVNLASSSGLQAGMLYALSGSGISAGTYFIYDDSVLAGFPGSINLTQATGAALLSETFQATQSTILGTALASLTEGSSDVSFSDTPDLPAGLYGVAGSAIGETDAPITHPAVGTIVVTRQGFLLVSSAFLDYDGAGSGHLQILVAEAHLDHQNYVAYYTVVTQEVRSLDTGVFPVEISGFETADPHSITDIPADALASLTPGLVYNITGNGLTIGTTFVAPSGGTAIALDLRATSSALNSILTINGPRTPDAPFDPSLHNRFDEEIINLEIAQEEGGFATLNVDIKYNGVGLLAVGRNIWCWLSWDQAWTPDGADTPDLVPLFNGRLVGVPKLQAGEIVRLEFLGRPDDFNAQKLAWANDLAVLPYYDPVWVPPPLNTDVVLEAYSSLWHIDRVDLSVTVSDILDGEAGTITISEDQAIYDNFSLSYQQPPLVAVNVSGAVEWQQQADGTLDITDRIVRAFHAAGSIYANPYPKIGGVNGITPEHFGNTFYYPHNGIALPWAPFGGGGLIQVYVGDGMKSSWPKPGTIIGGGWSLSSRSDYSGYPLNYILGANVSDPDGWLPDQSYAVSYTAQMPLASQAGKTTDQANVATITNPYGQINVNFPLNTYKVRMTLEYKADRKRTETVTAVLAAGVQRELSDSAENDRESISLTSQNVGQGVDANGAIPIGDLAYRSYFQTARGAQSFEYLMLVARAKIRARARSVDITFGVDWRTALGITLRHNVAYADRRVPGGGAVGKVKSYRLSVSGGQMWGEFTVGCTIGTGEVFPYQIGTAVYVDDGYVNPGYERMAGAQLALGDGDLYYQTLDDFAIVDDGLNLSNLTADQVIYICRVDNGMTTQKTAIEDQRNASLFSHFPDPRNIMKKLTTTVNLDLKPVQGSEYHTPFFPAVTPLVLPKTIDLSATSG